MFRVAIGLLVVALVAAVLGFGGIAGTAAGFAKIVFVVALVLAVIGFFFGRTGAVGLVAVLGALGAGKVAHAQGVVVNDHRAPEVEPVVVIEDQTRSGLTIGGGLGFGHIACEGVDCSGYNEAGGFDVHIGSMIAPGAAVLLDIWGMAHQEDRATFRQGIATAALRVWALPRLWIQGGVGAAQAEWDYDADVIEFESRSETVPAVVGAIGVELLASPSFGLDVALRAGTGLYEDDVRVRNVSLGIGLNFY